MRSRFTFQATLFLVFLISTLHSFSQKQAERWYFGEHAGLNFNNDTLVVMTDGQLSTPEGCSAISDLNGQLLLYTDGITVFNRLHDTMPNGRGLTGDISSTQSALIVPQPGNPDIYYVFTIDADGGINGFRYSIVDLTLDGGLGDVTSKNVLVKTPVTEKISAVSNRQRNEFWIMIHAWGSNAFEAYRLTSTGFNTTPVISNAGSVHQNNIIQNTYGQMKFSPNGKKLALAIGSQAIFELFDFDDSAGVVSYVATLPAAEWTYGTEISNDNSKLYINYYDLFFDEFYLDQFDISSGDSTAILASRERIYSHSIQLREMQLAPDGKIYVARGFQPYLAVIHEPNKSGAACNFQDAAIDLDPAATGLIQSTLGLPNFVQSFFDSAQNCQLSPANISATSDTICSSDSTQLCEATGFAIYLWNTGQNTRCFYTNQAGNYYLTATDVYGCSVESNRIAIAAYPLPPVSIIVSGDTLSSFGASSYQWYMNGNKIPGATGPVYIVTEPGNYALEITDANGCTALSTPVVHTNIYDTNEDAVHVYPNPFKDLIIISTPAFKEAEVYDVLGRIIYQQNGSVAMSVTMDASGFAPGNYYLRIKTTDGEYWKKLIK